MLFDIAIPANYGAGSAVLTATGEIYYCRTGEEALCFIQQVQVTLKSIVCDSASDGPFDSTLEVYGQITAQGNGLAQTLFNKDTNHTVSMGPGQTFGAPLISQSVITVAPKAGGTITLHAHLKDQDGLSGDDDLGDEISINPFETGWRKQSTVLLTGDGGIVRACF